LGVSKHRNYAWKAKYGGMSVNEAQRLRQLEDENQQPRMLVADLSMDKEMLKAVIGARRPPAEARWLWEHYLVSARRICGLMVLAEPSFGYLSEAMTSRGGCGCWEAAREKPRWAYRRLQVVVFATRPANTCRGEQSPRAALSGPNQQWALDLVHMRPRPEGNSGR
jgi:hypothetical protein